MSTAPTPLFRVELEPGLGIWCKPEFLNPSGSTKDRVARYILGDARQTGRLHPGNLVIEASSGSTSIAMAHDCNARRSERRTHSDDPGFRRTDPRDAAGIAGAIAESERLGAALGAFLPRQFSNILNVEAHRYRTAPDRMQRYFSTELFRGLRSGASSDAYRPIQ